MPWTYEQATGILKHDGLKISQGSSAHLDMGPWTVTELSYQQKLGPAVLSLRNSAGDWAHIHGASHENATASIVLPSVVRQLIWRSDDRELNVV
jgi:hypothetical protein